MSRIKHFIERIERAVEKDIDKIKRFIWSEEEMHSKKVQNFFTNKSLLPQAQSSEQLTAWLSTIHPRYNMCSWCFFGNITDHKGKQAAISSVVQYNILPKSTPYVSAWSYCDENTEGYVLAPFLSQEENVDVSNPFAVTVDSSPANDGFLTLSMVSGTMGKPGACYRMTGRVYTTTPGEVWTYDLALTDTFGVIQTGYGPSSFLPQWVFHDQKKSINEDFNGDVDAYLRSNKDNMMGQGSYYYSLPLLRVDSFDIMKNGEAYSSGKEGNIWIDYVVQSFDKDSIAIAGSASWQFFAVQFPHIPGYEGFEAALMVSIVETNVGVADHGTSLLKTARLYINDPLHGKLAENGAMQAIQEWTLDEITYDVTEKQGEYPTAFTLTLAVDNGGPMITVKGKPIMPNQVISEVKKYEGVFTVTADFELENMQVQNLKGYAWAELH